MTISIIGAGNVGGTLGRIWALKGHSILFGVRNPKSEKTLRSLSDAGPSAQVLFVKEAAARSEIVVLATPWESVPEVVFQIADMSGKILVDCTNPVRPNPEWPLSQGTSAAEEIAKRLPGFRVVKAFNTLGAGSLVDVTFESMKADGFLCGDDTEAKQLVGRLAEEVGLRPVDVGGLRNAELLESLAKLWITLAYQQGIGPNIAFKLLHRF
ncbi:MAG: NADPH-dependent F420 reductase [Bacteroidetes bacterium]|nr:MAG: NADPH-dependent F420 reductase [Bacteroidota bacterium]